MKQFFSAKYLSFSLSGLIILSLIGSYFVFPDFQEFMDRTTRVLLKGEKEYTQEYFEEFGLWGPLVIITFIVLQMFLIVFPSWLPIIIAVRAYGFWWGILISLTGVVIASVIGYYVGQKLKSAVLTKLIGEKKLEEMQYWISHYSYGTIVLFRISPFLSNDAISFIAGMLQMKFRKFIAATLTGMVPLSIAIGIFSEDPDTLKEGLYWVGGGGLVIYGLYIYLDHKKRKKKG